MSTPRAAFLLAILASAAGTCSSPSAPTPQPQAPSSQQPDVSLVLKGRIVDDLNTPVSGVSVALHASREVDSLRTTQTTTDANGIFDFTARVRGDLGSLDEVPIVLSRVGFESTEPWIAPNSARTIAIYPVTTVRSGNTLVTRIVAAAPYACGFESHRCRRILLEPAGETLTVEITATDGEPVGLVDDGPPLQPFDYAPAISVGDGELFVIGGPATVALRVRPFPPDPLVGRYSLTLVHGCASVPEPARTRHYTADIEPAPAGFVVTLSDAFFLGESVCTTTATPKLGCHQFLASREHDRIRFDLFNDDEWHGGYITERVPPGTWLQVFGSAVGRLEGGNVTARGTGGVWYCPGNPEYPFPCMTATGCRDVNLQMTFVRR